MSIRRILLPVSAEDDITQLAGFAYKLAEIHQAEVQGIFPQSKVWFEDWINNWGLSEDEIEALEEQAKAKAQEAERAAEEAFRVQALHYPNVIARFISTPEETVRSLTDFAMFADVAVIGNLSHAKSSYLQGLVNEMLAQSTKPLFVAPSRPVGEDLGERVVIAWKKSPEALRAITAAMPLIDKAAQVVIATVGDGADRQSLDHLRDYLSLHAKNTEIAVLERNGRRTGQVLIDKAAETPGSILVMGAYTHRRWREQVFGGVTQFVLNNTDVPALMMH